MIALVSLLSFKVPHTGRKQQKELIDEYANLHIYARVYNEMQILITHYERVQENYEGNLTELIAIARKVNGALRNVLEALQNLAGSEERILHLYGFIK